MYLNNELMVTMFSVNLLQKIALYKIDSRCIALLIGISMEERRQYSEPFLLLFFTGTLRVLISRKTPLNPNTSQSALLTRLIISVLVTGRKIVST